MFRPNHLTQTYFKCSAHCSRFYLVDTRYKAEIRYFSFLSVFYVTFKCIMEMSIHILCGIIIRLYIQFPVLPDDLLLIYASKLLLRIVGFVIISSMLLGCSGMSIICLRSQLNDTECDNTFSANAESVYSTMIMR